MLTLGTLQQAPAGWLLVLADARISSRFASPARVRIDSSGGIIRSLLFSIVILHQNAEETDEGDRTEVLVSIMIDEFKLKKNTTVATNG